MTANMIIRFFEEYGWIMTLLATTGIVFVGCLKAIGVFSKLKDGVKKYVYFATAGVVSVASCTVYLCVTNAFVWADWGMTVVFIIAYTMAIYAMYENTGIRALLRKTVFNPIKTLVKHFVYAICTKNMSTDQAVDMAKSLGKETLVQILSELTEPSECAEPDKPDDVIENDGNAASIAMDMPANTPMKLDGKSTLFS